MLLHQKGNWICPLPCEIARGDGRKLWTFYMYRAQDDNSRYPVQNINLGDIAGVMWYLHNEIVSVPGPERKYGISRIVRFKVSVRSTSALYSEGLRQFGQYVAFDRAQCTVPDCDSIWAKTGFVVGCQLVDTQVAAYVASYRTFGVGSCTFPNCSPGVWYSLPGSCPSKTFDEKTPECRRDMPGGRCPARVTGESDCTYNITEAGWIGLDELTGIPDRGIFTAAGHTEYNPSTDRGDGTDFWNGQHDLNLCIARTQKLQNLFDQKYPELQS